MNRKMFVGVVAAGLAFVACDVEEQQFEDFDEIEVEDRTMAVAPPDLTLAAMIQNGTQIASCGAGTVSVTVDEVNLGPGGVGQFWIQLLDASTGQPAAGSLIRPALAGNTSRTSTLTFNPYLGPCDTVPGICVPQTKNYVLFIDGGNLWPESNENNNVLGTLTYQTDCSVTPVCPPLVCPAPVEVGP